MHELGHFIVALLFRVKVEKFSIGFGPRITGFTKGGIEYALSIIPLGGYVKMKGENPNENEESTDEDSFQAKPWWKRAIIAFAGPFSNLLFAIIFMTLSFSCGREVQDFLPVIGHIVPTYKHLFNNDDRILAVNQKKIRSWNDIYEYVQDGKANQYTILRSKKTITVNDSSLKRINWLEDINPVAPAIIGEVTQGLPAYRAGLKENDKILFVDEKPINDWYDMRESISKSPKKTIDMTILRDKQQLNVHVELEKNILDSNSKMIGIAQKLPYTYHESYTLLESAQYGVLTSIQFMIANYYGLYKLIMQPRELKNNLGGPVMIYSMTKQSVQKGVGTFLSFLAALSIILMVMNLLPIPILDGGMIFFCFIEGIIRRQIPERVMQGLQQVGFMALIFLMVFAFYSDFSRIIKRNIAISTQNEKLR